MFNSVLTVHVCHKKSETPKFGRIKWQNFAHLDKMSSKIRMQKMNMFRELGNFLKIFKLLKV